MRKTQLIGITGGIASGKTLVSNYLVKKGFEVIDTDELAREVYAHSSIQKKILSKWKTLDRRKIRQLVFSDTKNRQWIEKLLHPYIWKAVQRHLKLLGPNHPFIFVVVPLLFETKSQYRFDKVVSVICPKTMQLSRLVKRDGISTSLAKKMIESQWTNKKKIEFSDYVIKNSGTKSELVQKINQFLLKLLSELSD
ncbi:MAG: dephospho-CoA kinase [Bdellovibrionales bacterium]|nr:dephospho-CoA kinase [Bdellovibrionales bacterium]